MSEAIVFNRSGADLSFIRDGTANLVFTSPPFFDDATESLLREPLEKQRKTVEVATLLHTYASSLQPVFNEIHRVVAKTGTIALHTKDIRYGNSLLPLAYWHEQLLREVGYTPLTKIYWMSKTRRRKSGKSNETAPHLGHFRSADLEIFSIFRSIDLPIRVRNPHRVALNAPWLADPVWITDEDAYPDRHQHAAPTIVLERILELYSLPGDLVVDPFCGGGGFLEVARKMGRDAVGTEISPIEYERCVRRLALQDQL